MKEIYNNRKGVTLVELLLSLALITIVIQVVYSMFFAGQNSFQVGNNKGFAQQGVRTANIFLKDELKYANSFISKEDFDFGIPNSKVHGIGLEDGKLIKKTFIWDEINLTYSETIEKSLSGEWDNIVIKNDRYGLLDVYVKKVEGNSKLSSDYVLDYTIQLENAPLIKDDVIWDLKAEDFLYFTKSIDGTVGSIILNDKKDDSIPDPEIKDPEDDSDPGNPVQIVINDIKYINGKLPKKDKNKFLVRATKNNESDSLFTIDFDFTASNKALDITVEEYGINRIGNSIKVSDIVAPSNNSIIKINVKIKYKEFSSYSAEKDFYFIGQNNFSDY